MRFKRFDGFVKSNEKISIINEAGNFYIVPVSTDELADDLLDIKGMPETLYVLARKEYDENGFYQCIEKVYASQEEAERDARRITEKEGL